METVTVSPKFRVVIPRRVRESLGIHPGQKIQVLVYENRMEFIPLRRMKEMRGFVRGIDTTVERDRIEYEPRRLFRGLEYFADGPNAKFFGPAIEELGRLIVSSINILEVFKRLLQQRGETDALKAVAHMQQGHVVDLLPLRAARISFDLKLPLADSVILGYSPCLQGQPVDSGR